MSGSTREALPQTLGVPINASHPLTRLMIIAVVTALALAVPAAGALAGEHPSEPDPSTPALTTPFALVEDRDVDDRLPQPEDRYALAGGCYTIEAPGTGFVTRDGDGLGLSPDEEDAEPFHFQATRLGEYLIATNEGPETRWDDAWWDERGYISAAGLLPGLPALPGPLGGVAVADEPSEAGEWEIAASGDDPDAKVAEGDAQSYVVSLAGGGQALTAEGGDLTLSGAGTGFAFRHVADGEGCATWPEIDTNTSGRPAPAENPAGEVQGFFEAHVHGMAYEFLGGKFRCGQPWHRYGVEYALGNCLDNGHYFNNILEVAVAGQSPADPVTSYDPVGWPTFSYWPQSNTLTHEQFYWRWLERAYHGGLRLLVNLLVENTALCEAYPLKENSCNEMDSVRLQAQRVFELQDYIDAQSGGPGEGWFRVVTSPAQAREAINAGRLAVVLGIEVSEVLDCRAVLDIPLCTAEQIDERLDEVFDMGVRQMQLINKFDNALSGVTGDGGATGVVVNTGNRWATGHWWDMQTCDDDHDHGHGYDGHEHDKTQLNPRDDVPGGDHDAIDVLAGAVLETFGATRGAVAPVYPPAPHCNTRGLTELGAHVIRGMIDRGIMFDPDHMSAAGMREALDLIEHEIIPAEHAAAAEENREAIQPGVISSHSWGNNVVYQRIFNLDGVVAPRTSSADGFVSRWAQHKDWAREHAPPDYPFGIGYGADTNGLGSQPGRRSNPAEPLDYSEGFAAPIGDVTVFQHTSGVRTYDVNDDGVAHYGLFADWFAELELAGEERAAGQGAEIITDMLRGAETYIQMWERAVYGGNDCVTDQSGLGYQDLHALLGLNVEGFMTAAGAPLSRDGAAYIYCVEGEGGAYDVVEVVFGADGLAAEVVPASLSSRLLAGQKAAASHARVHDHGIPLRAASDSPGEGIAHALVLLGFGALGRTLSSRIRGRAFRR